MARMSELDAALTALQEYSQGIQESVRNIRRLMSADAAPDPNEEPQSGQPAGPAGAEQPAEPETAYTLEQVRAVLYEKTKNGFQDEVKALLKAHGAARLTEIDPKEYPAMMKEARAIGK